MSSEDGAARLPAGAARCGAAGAARSAGTSGDGRTAAIAEGGPSVADGAAGPSRLGPGASDEPKWLLPWRLDAPLCLAAVGTLGRDMRARWIAHVRNAAL